MDVFAGIYDLIKIRDWAVKALPSYKSRLGVVYIYMLMMHISCGVGYIHFDSLSNLIW